MKKVIIAVVGIIGLTIGLVSSSQKVEAKTKSRTHVEALIPTMLADFSYERVDVKSYKVQDGVIYVKTTDGYEYIGSNIVIEKCKG